MMQNRSPFLKKAFNIFPIVTILSNLPAIIRPVALPCLTVRTVTARSLFAVGYRAVMVAVSLAMLFNAASVKAQEGSVSIQKYIETYRTVAMQEMRRYGIPASIKLAQGILESSFGNSELAINANNHFGIKCHGWPGPGYLYDDDAKDECFRMYNSPIESYLDHSQFLLTRPRYAFLFELDPTDYQAWAHGLRRAGYATHPNYPAKVIRVVEENNLTHYDKWAMDPAAELPALVMNNNTGPGTSINPIPSDNNIRPQTGNRIVAKNNRIKYIVARRGDTPESLSSELHVSANRIRRYNELSDGQQILTGQFIYLQPKRRSGPIGHHVVREGETMYIISQQYGIWLEYLYRRNGLQQGMEPQLGQRLLLRGRVRR